MATTSSGITALYEDVVASLIPYFDNAVLLPNSGLIVNSYNITGAVGNTMKIPVTDSFTAGSTIGEGNSIISGATRDFTATNVPLTVAKRGAGTLVTEESLEDGGMDTVRTAVITRISRALAQATDIAGFRVMLTGSESALTDIANISGVSNDGVAAASLAGADVAVVFSPEAMGYAMKREPTVKMFNNVDYDRYEMAASVRNGFARVRAGFIRAVTTSNVIAESNTSLTANLTFFSRAVANLRAVNAPTDAAGFYAACVTAAQEYHLAAQLNGVGGAATYATSSMIGNQALLDGLIGQAVGVRFYRSNNLPSNLLSA